MDTDCNRALEAVVLRRAVADDKAFLLRLYASTREEELAQTGWGEAEKRAFLVMQFDAQDRHYREHFPDARFDIVEVDGEAAGRLYVDCGTDEIRVLDIALLPEQRGRGVGRVLMRALQSEATSHRKPVVLHVEEYNPACRLYLRLGFVPVKRDGIHIRMMWRGGLPDAGGRRDEVPAAAAERTAMAARQLKIAS